MDFTGKTQDTFFVGNFIPYKKMSYKLPPNFHSFANKHELAKLKNLKIVIFSKILMEIEKKIKHH